MIFLYSKGCRSPPSIFNFKNNKKLKIEFTEERQMFDNKNDYTLRTEIIDGAERYFASFENSEGKVVETEISEEIKNLMFGKFVRKERNLRRSDERHMEYSHLTELEFTTRALLQPLALEDDVMKNLEHEKLHQAIAQLSETQKRRVKLYYFEELTLEQIAEKEGCKKMAIKFSLDIGKEKIKTFFEK